MIDLRNAAVRHSLMQSLQKVSMSRKTHSKQRKRNERKCETLLKQTPQSLKVTNSIHPAEGLAETDDVREAVFIESGDLRL